MESDGYQRDAQPPRGIDGAELLAVVEDDRLRAVVTTSGATTLVRLEGRLDRDLAPVVDELLTAVERWHAQGGRRRSGGPADGGSCRAPVPGRHPTLLVDTTGVDLADRSGERVLEEHCARWVAERGPYRRWQAEPVTDRAGSPHRGSW
jgi:hypothetical protein